ncbi:MAG: hypothetical protein WCO48_02735 [Candidatus Taylorbacteria bacterium]
MNILFNIKTSIRRKIAYVFDLNRPSSYPFITGDGFRALAQHHFDEISDIKPNNVEENDIVFVRSDFLKIFFKDRHSQIKNRYILISHNDDTDIDESYAEFIDDKIVHWFAQNLCFKHPKITPIPIGIQNLRYNETGKLKYFNQEDVLKDVVKDTGCTIRYGFRISSHTDRSAIKEILENSELSKEIGTFDQDKYIDIVHKSRFIASPRGRGLDCHRTWEAIYLKAVPIVLRDVMTGPDPKFHTLALYN